MQLISQFHKHFYIYKTTDVLREKRKLRRKIVCETDPDPPLAFS